MKTTFIFCGLILSFQIIFAQNNKDNAITGNPISLEIPYPLLSDDEIINDSLLSELFIYPTLIVNNIIVTDTEMINCFRNHYKYLREKRIIYKPKFVRLEQAQKMGLTNVSRDGAIIIKTRKKHFIDLSNCYFD